VYAKAAELAAELLAGVLDGPTFREQPSAGATYAAKITAEDRWLDLELPAATLVNVVRALSPHIGARARLHGRDVTVWRARVADDGSFEPLEVQPDGGRRMAYEAWLRGLRP
jgi:methionyl-tRNA formyltransferase